MNYIVINLATAECSYPFLNREVAEKFCEKINIPELLQAEWEDDNFDMGVTERTLIMPVQEVDDTSDYELQLYSNTNKDRPFNYVADYYEDTLNNDFISTQDIPVRVCLK